MWHPKLIFLFFSLVFWATKQKVDVATTEKGAKLSFNVLRNRKILVFPLVSVSETSHLVLVKIGFKQLILLLQVYLRVLLKIWSHAFVYVNQEPNFYFIIITWNKSLVSQCLSIEIDNQMNQCICKFDIKSLLFAKRKRV